MRQKIRHGAEIDVLTPDEARVLLAGERDPAQNGRAQGYSGLFDVVVGNFDHPEPVLLTSPPARRLRITRHGRGGDKITVSTALAQILDRDEGRMAGQLVNYGANNVFLYLGSLADVQAQIDTVPALWIKSAGGSWDFSVGNALWGGDVCAAADAGTTLLTLAEL